MVSSEKLPLSALNTNISISVNRPVIARESKHIIVMLHLILVTTSLALTKTNIIAMLHNHYPACAENCHLHVHAMQPFKNFEAQITESCFAPKIVHVYTAMNYILTVLRETPVCMNIFTRFIISKT